MDLGVGLVFYLYKFSISILLQNTLIEVNSYPSPLIDPLTNGIPHHEAEITFT